jgi:hypothetical protein
VPVRASVARPASGVRGPRYLRPRDPALIGRAPRRQVRVHARGPGTSGARRLTRSGS